MSIDSSLKGIYRVGGLALIVSAIVSLLGIFMPRPAITAERVMFFQIAHVLYALSFILLIPALLALYFALKEVKKTHMIIAIGFAGVAIPLGLGAVIVELSRVSLWVPSEAAASEALRAAYMVAGDVARVAKTAGFTLFNLLSGVAILIIGFVMLKGVFSKATAFLGIVTGIALMIGGAITPITPYYVSTIFVGPLFLIWSLAVGYKLYRLG